MADLSIFKLDSETITIKDSVARQTADNAKTLATTASGNATTALNNINELESEISSLKSDLANKLYPVGSIYMSVNATNPAELFGGTWGRLKDRFLLAAGDSYAAGSTGGEAQHTLTVDEMPSHAHVEMANNTFSTPDGISKLVDSSNNGEDKGFIFDLNGHPLGGWSSTGKVIKTMPSGGSSPHNNMPPYLAVYMWKRTA